MMFACASAVSYVDLTNIVHSIERTPHKEPLCIRRRAFKEVGKASIKGWDDSETYCGPLGISLPHRTPPNVPAIVVTPAGLSAIATLV